jgi:transposase
MKTGKKPTAQRGRHCKIQARAQRVEQYRRHELLDPEWKLIQPLVPPRTAKTGRTPKDPRLMLNGILWILRTGAPWRDLPERFGPWPSIYDYFSKWRQTGVYDRILHERHIRLDRNGQIDWDIWCLDGSSVRAARAAAGADKKVSNAIPRNPPTTRWAARAADSQANSTWLLTATACR